MHFEPTASIREAGTVLLRLGPIIDKRRLRRRAEELNARIAANPILHDYLSSKYAVELALDWLFRRQRLTGRGPRKFRDRATAEAMSFALALTKVHRRLPREAQIKLQQRLYGSLKGDNSLAPIVHELTVAVHLMNLGWDVEFHDLERGGFEYIARKGAKEIEVECKRVGTDAGRKIHRNDFYRLASPLFPTLGDFARRRVADIVHLRVDDRLPSRDEHLARLRSAVLTAMETETPANGDTFTVDIRRVGLNHPGNVGVDVMQQEVQHHVGTTHVHLAFAGQGADFAVLAVTSEKPDRVLSTIYRQLKDAASQFSLQRPAVIWTYIEDIEPQVWRSLVDNTGLQRMSYKYMAGETRQHVFSMAYSSAGELMPHDGGLLLHGGPVLNYNRLEPEYQQLADLLYG
jgi:hypothetical protein